MCRYIKKLHTFHVVKLWESGKKKKKRKPFKQLDIYIDVVE